MLKKNLMLRITCIVTLLVLLLFVVNAAISSGIIRSRFKALDDDLYQTSASYTAETVNGWFTGNNEALMAVVAYVNSYKGGDISGMHAYFAEFLAEHPNVTEIYYGRADNSYVFGSDYVPPADYKISERGWYTGAKAVDGIYVTEPYMDTITGGLCISISSKASGGVVGIDLDLNALTGSIPSIADGYTIIATAANTIIVHPNPDFALTANSSKSLGDVLGGSYMSAISSGKEFTDYNGEKSYIIAAPIPVNNWTAAIVTPASVYNGPINATLLAFVILTVIFCIIAAIVVAIVSHRITRPIKLMSERLLYITNGIRQGHGDLTARVNYRSEDELGEISHGINKLMAELEELIPKSKQAANTVSGNSKEFADMTTRLTDAMSGISQAVEDIANGATQQANDVQSATQNVDQIGVAIDSVVDSANELDDIAKDMHETSDATGRQIEDLQKSTDTMVSGIDSISEKIRDTSRVVDSITEKVSTISEIASQTNLLSLNASIEAARAGEMGRGFAVVAEEIGKLAVDSAAAAEDIKKEMDALLTSSQATVDESEKVHQMTVSQQEVLGKTTKTISSLLSQIESTISHVGDIKRDVEQCVSSKNVIATAMENLSAISEENAASTQETSATTAEVGRTIETLAASSQEMNSVATELMDSLSIFDDVAVTASAAQ